MFQHHQRHMGQGGGLPGILGPLAGWLALGGTIIFAPHIWPHIEHSVTQTLFELYRHEIAVWLVWSAKLGVYPLSFFALRVGIMGAFMWLSLIAARRLM